MAITLSFCIPTYNFGQFIGETLDSIIRQSDDRVEIVIVDGGSTDNTAEVVAAAARRFQRIKFVQRDRRCGVDRDILETVRHASGKFCWLLSSDDLLAPNAVAKVVQAIDKGGWDVLLTGMMICNLTMQPLYPHPILNTSSPASFDWSDQSSRRVYCSKARTTTAFFSFISDIVVNRERWQQTEGVDRFIGSCWIIAAKIFAMGRTGLVVRFDPDIFVRKRGENDSFAARGRLARTQLSVQGFREVAWHFFGRHSFEASQVGRVLQHEYGLSDLLVLKRAAQAHDDPGQVATVHLLARLHYGASTPQDIAQYLVLRWMPRWIDRLARPAHRTFGSFVGAVRAVKKGMPR
jgi:abequosyltransferase